MDEGKNYLLGLDSAPTITAKAGEQGTIFDWSAGKSFQVIVEAVTMSNWYSLLLRVFAIFDNSYGVGNFKGSRLRYRDAENKMESREIIKITPLDEGE